MAMWKNKEEKFIILTLDFLENNTKMYIYIAFKLTNNGLSEISYSDKISTNIKNL
uniref:Uncharacterized protein n=1 Tax=viral metagenome TaxID=1070528 RepID=A0A6C0AFH7_9ZZZZ